MAESCWYQTNLANLWRYAKNRARNFSYDKDADVELVEKEFHKDRGSAHPNLTAGKVAAAQNVSSQSPLGDK